MFPGKNRYTTVSRKRPDTHSHRLTENAANQRQIGVGRRLRKMKAIKTICATRYTDCIMKFAILYPSIPASNRAAKAGI